LSAVRDCLFSIFATTLHIAGRSSIHNLRTRYAAVTETHLSRCANKQTPNIISCAFLPESQLLGCLPSTLQDAETKLGWSWSVIVVSPQAIVEGLLPTQLSNR